MTETAQIQPIITPSTPTLYINREHAAIHLAILGDRPNYIATAKNHNTNKVRNEALTKAEILTFAEDVNNQGFCVWISLNPKEGDGNIYVTALADFWLDIDARPKGIDDRAATQQEIDEAYDRTLKLKEHVEKTYGATGFIAFSGNGYHLHFPLPHTEFTLEQRALIGTSKTDTVTNAKVRNFAKQTAANIGKTIDNTYDINRKTALIGSFNLKISNHPIQTNWLEDFLPETLEGTLKSVDYARNQNQKLLEAILNTPTDDEQRTETAQTVNGETWHIRLNALINSDVKFKAVYNGDVSAYKGDNDRSDAENYLVCKLITENFNDQEINAIMANCKLGKWQEEGVQYQETTLKNAHEFITKNQAETESQKIQKTFEKFYTILHHYPEAKTAYEGNYQKHYTTPKGADLDLLKILTQANFTTEQKRFIIAQSKVDYWNNTKTTQEAKDNLLIKAEREVKAETEQKQPDDDARASQADRLVQLCLEQNIELFHDNHRQTYARITDTDETATDYDDYDDYDDADKSKRIVNYLSITPLNSQEFKDYLSSLMYKHEGKTANLESINAALGVLRQQARNGAQHQLYNRAAPDPSGDGSIWIDIADKHNHAYHVTIDGWSLCSSLKVPIVFKRYDHQQPLVIAKPSGDPWKLLKYTHLKSYLSLSNQSSESSLSSLDTVEKVKFDLLAKKALLLMVQTVSYGIPEIAHPINELSGPHGTHKSTEQRFIASIWDPSSVPKISIDSATKKDVFQFLDHHYIPIIDNMSFMPYWLSDMLCCAVTGAGLETRSLFTNDDSFIRAFRRCPMINGLNVLPEKGDLLDRTFAYEAEQDNAWRTEKELDAEYAKDLPEILGGFLDVQVKALKIYPVTNPKKTFRLTDFGKWGCALTLVLGKKEEDFNSAYESMVEKQNVETLNNPVTIAFVSYCKSVKIDEITHVYENSPEIVFSNVTNQAISLEINTRNKCWPKAANVFTRKLNECRAAIQFAGWAYDVIPGVERKFRIWKIDKKPAPQKGKKRLCKDECKNWSSMNVCPLGSGSFSDDLEVSKECSKYDYKGTPEEA